MSEEYEGVCKYCGQDKDIHIFPWSCKKFKPICSEDVLKYKSYETEYGEEDD